MNQEQTTYSIPRASKAALQLAGLLVALSASLAWAHEESQSALQAQAHISKSTATATAKRHLPDGAVKSAELERENGHLIWSFDMTRPGTKDITEIQVDAINGKIVSEQTETPEQQARESD